MSRLSMNEKVSILQDGIEYPEHQEFIIGNRTGIQSLKDACEKALEHDICDDQDLGDYLGVKILEDDSFYNDNLKKPEDSSLIYWFLNLGFWGIILLLLGFCFLVGLGTIISWM
ncbi:MAG: hypothetical protein OCC49_19250 [Fibrobacterales bacterium]